MSTLPDIGSCEYNGVDLNSPEFETLGISCKPIPDSSGRTTAYVRTSVRIRTIIFTTPPLSTDGTIDTIRSRLTAQGGAFIYSSKGAGDIRANVPGEDAKDVCYGPRCEIIQLTPKGSAFAWELVAEFVICLPECDTAIFRQPGVLEMCFTLSFSIDQAGYSRRTYQGHIAVPATRLTQANRTLQNNADDYRAKIYPKPLPGFRRTRSDFQLNEDKTRLTFTIEDDEMGPNIPPPGVASIRADHSQSNSEPYKFATYVGTLSADYELQKGANLNDVRRHFLEMWDKRRRAILASPNVNGGTVLPLKFSCREPDIFGRQRMEFSLSYTIVLSLSTVVGAYLTAGLWQQHISNGWLRWSATMKSFDPRGSAQLAFSNNDDLIIDLCVSPPNESKLSKSSRSITTVDRGNTGKLQSSYPTPEFSWIFFQNAVFLELVDSTIEHKPLALQLMVQPNIGGDTFDQSGGFRPVTVPSLPTTVLQQRGAASFFVWMKGKAIRAGFQINPPTLVSIGGIPAVPANIAGCGFAQKQIGINPEGVPIYSGEWRFRYLIPRPPTVVPVPSLPPSQQSTSALRRGT